MTDTETHRQFYLGAAGITLWYAKRPLPGAAPSPEYHFSTSDLREDSPPDDVAEVLPQPDLKAERNLEPARSPSVNLQALMASPEQAKPETKIDQPVEPVTSEKGPDAGVGTEAEAEVRPVDLSGNHSVISAELSLWSSEKYLLISRWSDEASERLQDSLASNVLRALHQADVGERQTLRWPVFRNPNIPGNSVEDFQDVLLRMVSARGARSIILLGVLGDQPDEQRKDYLKPLLAQADIDFPLSLAELSASSGQKRDLWNTLKTCYSV